MAHVVLLACCKTKSPYRCQAQHLYQGALFKKALAYAKHLSPDAVLILSAKHGVLSLQAETEPYEETLRGAAVSQRRAWTDRVFEQLRQHCDPGCDRFTILASRSYCEFLVPKLGVTPAMPLEGLKQGQQLKWLKERLLNV